MIVIAGSVKIKPEHREEASRVALEMARATQAEKGCLSYRFSSDLADPSLFFLFEEWESPEHLGAHFETEHMRAFLERLPKLVAEPPSIRRYVVESVAPM